MANVKKYVLPCGGYDRPGGEVSRIAAEHLAEGSENLVIGSMGALFNERPGEIRDFRTSEVYCLDGCAVNCASDLARARGRSDIISISIPDISAGTEGLENKAKQVVDAVRREFDSSAVRTSSTPSQEPQAKAEYLEAKFDKFSLRIEKGLKYSDNDFWVRIEDNDVRIGASDFLQQMMSDVFYVELSDPEIHVDMFEEAGSMESTKTLVEIIVPVAGTIMESNVSLGDRPELINESPYDNGWLYLIRPDNIDELELLKDAADYQSYALERAKKEIGKKVE